MSNECLIQTHIEGAVSFGPGSRAIHCTILNRSSEPLVIGANVELISCLIVSDPTQRKGWSYYRESVHEQPTTIGANAKLTHCTIINSVIGSATKASHGYIEFSDIGPHNDLRRFANVTLTRTGRAVALGSETSKCLIGDGFISEHCSSYLSLLAPTTLPIIEQDGSYVELPGIPNVSNIGAGTVFANYSGELTGAGSLFERDYEKGTAVAWSTFTCINARIINRYGKVLPSESYLDLLRRRDLTLLGFASFVENKITGRVPAFSLAGVTGMSSAHHRIGWVLESKPALLLTVIRNALDYLGPKGVALMNRIIPGTIRLELALLEEERRAPECRYTETQLEEGLRILHANLDGRWLVTGAMDLPALRI